MAANWSEFSSLGVFHLQLQSEPGEDGHKQRDGCTGQSSEQSHAGMR